jgi:hypothetical protein
MPHSGSFGFILTLHVLGAVFIVGPLVLVTVAAPLLLRSGRAALPVLHLSLRAVRWLAVASLLIAATGLAILRQGTFGSVRTLRDTWLAGSLLLWVVAVTVTLGVVAPGLARAVRALEGGRETVRWNLMITGGAMLTTVCWALIIALMVVKPGS